MSTCLIIILSVLLLARVLLDCPAAERWLATFRTATRRQAGAAAAPPEVTTAPPPGAPSQPAFSAGELAWLQQLLDCHRAWPSAARVVNGQRLADMLRTGMPEYPDVVLARGLMEVFCFTQRAYACAGEDSAEAFMILSGALMAGVLDLTALERTVPR